MPYLPKFILSFILTKAPSHRLQYFRNAKKVARRVAKDLIDSKTEAVSLGKDTRDVMSLLGEYTLSCFNPLFTTNLTIIVRANNSEEAKTRMDEEEMISQMRWGFGILTLIFSLAYVYMDCAHCSTLLLAGFETTATSLSWSLLEIARHTNVQDKLRREIRAKEREIKARGDIEFTSNDFDTMPYLTAVLKVSSL